MGRDPLEDELAHGLGEARLASDGRVLVTDNGASEQIEDPWGGENDRSPFHDGSDSVFKSDYEHDIEQMHQAQYGPNGELLNELDSKFYKHELEEDDRAREAPHVTILPRSLYSAQLGGRATVVSGGQTSRVVDWHGETEEVLAITVALSVDQFLPVGDGKSYRPYANVTYGADGGFQTLQIDVCRGQRLIVLGSSVQVDVGMDAAPSGENPGTMDVQAFIAVLAHSRGNGYAQRTRYIDGLPASPGPGNTTNVLIPAGATALLPLQLTGASGTARMDFKDSNNVIRYTLTVLLPGQQVAPAPISGDIYSVDITNLDTVVANMRAIFQLCA